LLKEGKLSGGEYYAIKRDKILYGLEEEKKHKENIKRLGNILDNQERYGKELEEIEKQIKCLRAKYTSKGSREFNKEVKRYKEEKISGKKFYKIIDNQIEKINKSPEKYANIVPIKKEEYPNIEKYKRLLKESREIKEKKVSKELQEVIERLKEELPYNEYKMLTERTNNFREVSVFSGSIREVSERVGIEISKEYKELDIFLKNNKLMEEINPVEMVEEERKLIEKIRQAYVKGKVEGEIEYIEDFYRYLRDYLGNKLMALDYEYVERNIKEFKRLYGEYAVINRVKGLEKEIEIIKEYYKENNERNEIFVKNIIRELEEREKEREEKAGEDIHDFLKEQIQEREEERKRQEEGNESIEKSDENEIGRNGLQERRAKECLKKGKGVVIAVTGGYHTLGLGEILGSRGITSIVITPTVVGDIRKAEEIYEGVVKEESKYLREGLSFTIASQMPKEEQFRYFVEAGLGVIKEEGYLREKIRQLVAAVQDSFGEGTAEVVRGGEEEIRIRFGSMKEVTIKRGEKGKESFIREEILTGRIVSPKEQIKRFYEFAYNKGISSILSREGLIFELDEYVRRKKVEEIEGVSIEVIAKMPKEIQEYMFAKILGREVNIKSFSERTRAIIAEIVEIGYIFRASVDKEYFEEFLRMHDVEGDVERERKYEIRKIGLAWIRQAVNTALNQTGVSLVERYSRAIEKAFGLHVEHNIAHPDAKLELDETQEQILHAAI
jgi:hypothetical protein